MFTSLHKIATGVVRRMAARNASAVTPAAAAAGLLSVSSQLRALADELEHSNHETTACHRVAESLKSLVEQLVATQPSPGNIIPDKAAAVQTLERSYAAPPAVQVQRQDQDAAAEQPRAKKQKRGDRPFDFAKYEQRYVALHVMYIGWSYQGLARQADSENTIEGVLFPALRRVKLIPEDADISTLDYSRCGRTDKGVSALGQVLALRLRSSALAGQQLPAACAELDYPSLINRALPDTIRVLGWADVAPEFSARFNCRDREYKYFIVQDGSLDLAAMQQAAQHLVGEHDFRNFCKADVAQVKNFRREVLSANIEPVATCCPGMSVVALHIKGTAFLWHQVRCIAAVLLMVGRGQEHPCIIQQLLDLKQFPSKPQYSLAAEDPLLLFSCGFEGIQWHRNEASLSRCLAVIGSQLQQHLVAAALTSSVFEQIQQERAALLPSLPQQHEQQNGSQLQQQPQLSSQQHAQQHIKGVEDVVSSNSSSGLGAVGFSRWLTPKPPHIRLAKRATEPSIEERFMKAGISLELLNQKGGCMQE